MKRFGFLVLVIVILVSACSESEQKNINSAKDVPQIAIQLKEKPSLILRNQGESIDNVIQQLESFVNQLNEQYVINDENVNLNLLRISRNVALAKENWDMAIKYTQQIESLPQTSVVLKLETMTAYPLAKAMKQSAGDRELFTNIYSEEISKQLNKFDMSTERAALLKTLETLKKVNKELIIGSYEKEVDKMSEEFNHEISPDFANSILNAYRSLTTLEKTKGILIEQITGAINKYDFEQAFKKPNKPAE